MAENDHKSYSYRIVNQITTPISSVIYKIRVIPMEGAKADQGSIMSDLGALLESTDGADVTLVVGSSEYPAHSAILSARSPVFGAMLRSDMKEARSRRIEITDMREDVLRQVLLFIYTDTAPKLGSVAGELLAVADKYDLPLLKKRCEDKMAQDMDVENAGATAALAVMHRCLGLRAAAVKFMAGHPQVLATGGWVQVLRENAEAAAEICQQLAGVLPRTLTPRKQTNKAAGNRILTEEQRQALVTRLVTAASAGHTKEVWALLEAGAPVDAKAADGDSALHKAAKCCEGTVKCLMDAGADVNARDASGRTPLHRAAPTCQGDYIVWMLVAASAQLDLQDNEGETPLHVAARSGGGYQGHSTLKALLLAGARRDIRNNNEDKPVDVGTTCAKPLFDKY